MAVDTFDPQQFDPSRQSQCLDAGQVADALHAALYKAGAPSVTWPTSSYRRTIDPTLFSTSQCEPATGRAAYGTGVHPLPWRH